MTLQRFCSDSWGVPPIIAKRFTPDHQKFEKLTVLIRALSVSICLLGLFDLAPSARSQQTPNTVSVAASHGEDVGAKITSAQSTCLSNPKIPCTLIIDSSLALLPQGTLPPRCPNCTWIDMRNAGILSIEGLASFGKAPAATFRGFPASSPQFLRTLQSGSSEYYASPSIYLSRVDSTPYATGKGQCFQGPLAACDAPIAQIDFTNGTTGNIPGMVGVEVFGWGFKANGPSPSPFSNYEVGFGANMQDAPTPNITNLRGANFNVVVEGLPVTTGPGGFTRTGVTLEGDVNNSSGADAVARISGGDGNYIAGTSMVANGMNSSSAGYVVASSVSTADKGWRAGFVGSGITDVGFGEYIGGKGAFSPTIGFAAQAANKVGFLCGAGTVHSDQGSLGNPATCFLADALGTAGKSETANSGVIAFRAKNASQLGTDWHIQHVAGDALEFTLIGSGNYFKLGNTGHLVFSGAPSQHIDTASANNDIDGEITVNLSTSASHNFASPYANAPSCVLTPRSDPSLVSGWWVTTSATAITANIKTQGTISFYYHCVGSPR